MYQPNERGIDFGEVDLSKSANNIFIIASGPSLKGFDLNSLNNYNDKIIISVNQSIKHILFADIWCTTDPRTDLPPDKFAGKCYASVFENYNQPSQLCSYNLDDRITFVRKFSTGTTINNTRSIDRWWHRLSEDPGILANGNSTFTALNIAYLLNPKTIYILGLDASTGYFYNNSNRQMALGPLDDLFSRAVKQLERKNIKVYNCSPNSKVNCFEKISLVSIPNSYK